MAYSLVSFSSAGMVESLEFPAPNSGDLIYVYARENHSTTVTPGPAMATTGYEAAASAVHTSDRVRVDTFWKQSDGTETSITITGLKGAYALAVAVYRDSNGGVWSIDDSGTSENDVAGSSSLATDTLTPTVADVLGITTSSFSGAVTSGSEAWTVTTGTGTYTIRYNAVNRGSLADAFHSSTGNRQLTSSWTGTVQAVTAYVLFKAITSDSVTVEPNTFSTSTSFDTPTVTTPNSIVITPDQIATTTTLGFPRAISGRVPARVDVTLHGTWPAESTNATVRPNQIITATRTNALTPKISTPSTPSTGNSYRATGLQVRLRDQDGFHGQWETWLGRPITYQSQIFGKDLSGTNSMTGTAWSLSQQRPASYVKIEAAFPLAFGVTGRDDMAQVTRQLEDTANGVHASKYDQVFTYAMEGGHESRMIWRPGWEFDFPWSAWAITSGVPAPVYEPAVTAYIAAFRWFVNRARTFSSNWEYTWCGSHNLPFYGYVAYPGGNWVDHIGMNFYAMGPHGHIDTQAEWEADALPKLRRHRDLAIGWGKQICYPEWALSVRYSNNASGDNPVWMRGKLDFIDSCPATGPGSVSYATWFNDVDFRLYPNVNGVNLFPQSRVIYYDRNNVNG